MALDGAGRDSQENPRAEALVDEQQESVEGFEPSTDADRALYPQGMALVNDVEDQREIRLLQSHQDVHTNLWYVLVVGGVLTVSLTFFFGTEVLWLHRLSVAALTVVVVLLYATYQVQYPFSGSVRIGPDAYEEVLNDIEEKRQPSFSGLLALRLLRGRLPPVDATSGPKRNFTRASLENHTAPRV